MPRDSVATRNERRVQAGAQQTDSDSSNAKEPVMKAVCWCGKMKVKVEEVADPEIINPRDIIVRVTSTAICGSDLHLYNGLVPGMMKGDILGHEFMGEVVELG